MSSSSVAATRPTSLASWVLAIRPATLPASAAGVLAGLGAAQAGGASFRLDTAFGCLLAALLLQAFANLANDLSDFRRGADTPDRLGPTRAVAAGLISPRKMQAGMLALAAAAGLDGAFLAFVGGPAILGLGIAAVIAAMAYTGGPWPFGYRGLGELFVFVFFGPVCVVGTAYLQTGRVEPLYLAASIPAAAFATAILVVNNLRDIDTDRAAGKWTLAVRFGKGFARAEYAACLVFAWLIPVALILGRGAGIEILDRSAGPPPVAGPAAGASPRPNRLRGRRSAPAQPGIARNRAARTAVRRLVRDRARRGQVAVLTSRVSGRSRSGRSPGCGAS